MKLVASKKIFRGQILYISLDPSNSSLSMFIIISLRLRAAGREGGNSRSKNRSEKRDRSNTGNRSNSELKEICEEPESELDDFDVEASPRQNRLKVGVKDKFYHIFKHFFADFYINFWTTYKPVTYNLQTCNKNRNFDQKILVQDQNFGRHFKFWSKIEILVENRNFGRKSKF